MPEKPEIDIEAGASQMGNLVQFLLWIAARPRTYAETMEAWRTNCPPAVSLGRRHGEWPDRHVAGRKHGARGSGGGADGKGAELARVRPLYTVATGVAGDPTAPGRFKGGAVNRKRLRPLASSHRASLPRYHISPIGMPSLKMQ